QWREEDFGANLDAYLDLTRDSIAASQPRLVVWPENAMTFFLDEEAAYRHVIAATLSPHGTQLLAGGPRRAVEGAATRFVNSAFLVAPAGAILAAYEKRRLVPLAESFPLLGGDALRERFGRVREFSVGAETRPLPTAVGPAGVLICNEAMF